METVPTLLAARLGSAVAEFGYIEPSVSIATDPRFGDYQTNVAMVLAKQQRANPRQLAQQIIDRLNVGDICEPPEIAGAGFINFRLRRDFLNGRVTALLADEKLGV